MGSFEGLLARWLPEYGCEADAALVAKLARYLELVTEAQGRMRLVGSVEPEVLVRRHVGESLALLQLRPGVSGGLVDVGSGAGFPGLVLALARRGLETTLVEATRKKALFLQRAVAELGLGERVKVENRYLERQPPRRNREVAQPPLAGDALPPVGLRLGFAPRQGRPALAHGVSELPRLVAGAAWVTVRALERMEEVPGWLGRWLDRRTEVAFWVTRELAERWRGQYTAWSWEAWAPLAGAHSRGLLLGSVSRETLPRTRER